MHTACQSKRRAVPFVLLCLAVSASALAAQAAVPEGEIVGTFAKAAMDQGEAVGIGVAVISGTNAPTFHTYGYAVAGDGSNSPRPFRKDDLFEIGSVTKVFTTNLYGQAINAGQLSLQTPLSQYAAQLGPLQGLTGQITLLDLADFTAGMPSYAPLCRNQSGPGCLPAPRPPVKQYTARDFAQYFGGMTPLDYQQKPPQPVSALPAPYFYSDYGVGLLGLLLASTNAPLANSDLQWWNRSVQQNILSPLAMKDTFLYVPQGQDKRRARGYQQAVAFASVAGGQVTGITLVSPGGAYTQAPAVHINGGGGSGAQASATVQNGRVTALSLGNGGTGYVTPAAIAFNNGGSSVIARARIIVKDGKVAAISVGSGGQGYTKVPTVTIQGGRNVSGRDATATAHLANGRVAYVTVDDPGEGYVQPLSVVIDPGGGHTNTVPIWAAAGALKSTLQDMAAFARAALLAPRQQGLYPAALSAGFQLSEAAYACTGANPSLADCPQGAMQSAMSWAVQPADTVNGVPQLVMKDGGLPGYSTFVSMMPDASLAVVVMINSRPPMVAGQGNPVPIQSIANNILYALYAAGAGSGAGAARPHAPPASAGRGPAARPH